MDNNKKINKNLYKRLLKYAMKYIWHFALAVLIILIIVAIELYQPVLLGDAVDKFLSHYNQSREVSAIVMQSDINGVIKIAFIYLLTVIVIFFLNYAQALILAGAGQKNNLQYKA
jgi:ATP-binding cassette subfamily B protein